jgi:HTH-type transcriptional regulator/antitoxin HigA
MERPVQAINEIINGSKTITPETAIQLERVLGVPGNFWVRLEADYRYNKARLEQARRRPASTPARTTRSRLSNVSIASATARAAGTTDRLVGKKLHRKPSRSMAMASKRRATAGGRSTKVKHVR